MQSNPHLRVKYEVSTYICILLPALAEAEHRLRFGFTNCTTASTFPSPWLGKGNGMDEPDTLGSSEVYPG